MKNLFKGKQYDYKIIIETIGLYYHFGLSFRDCAKIMRKFSIPVTTPLSIDGISSMVKFSIIYGRKEIGKEDYLNHGGLTKPMSK